MAKIPKEIILKILEANVFPFVSEKEILKVDFKVAISFTVTEEDTQ